MNRKIYYIKKVIELIGKLILIIIEETLKLIGEIYKGILRRLRFSITLKLTTIYAINFILILIVLSILTIGGFTGYLFKVATDDMKRDFKISSQYILNNISTNSTNFSSMMDNSDFKSIVDKSNVQENIKKLINKENTYINIFDKNKKLINTISHINSTENSSILFYEKGNLKRWYFIRDKYMFISNTRNTYGDYIPFNNKSITKCLVYTEKIKVNNEDTYIQIIRTLSDEILIIEGLLKVLIIIDIVSLLIIVVSGSRASKKMLIPINGMINTVKNINANDLDARIDVVKSHDELKDLAETFNEMLDRIQYSYENQKQFASDASHELRTPISVIQGYVNLLDRWGKGEPEVLEESIQAIKSESENMKSLIEKLLFLARGDKNTQKIEKEVFYLNDLIEELIKETKMIAPSHIIVNEKNDTIKINGDQNLIKESLRAFIDNAIKYTSDGGEVKINSFIQKNKAVIVIQDTGIGIEKEDIPHIFDRFYRADKSRTKNTGGTGLGLAIAKWVMDNHNGTIEIKSVVDVGTKIIINLPEVR